MWNLIAGIEYMECGITKEEPYQYFIDFDKKYKIPNPQPKGCYPCVNSNCGGWYDPKSIDNSNGECWVCTETREDAGL